MYVVLACYYSRINRPPRRLIKLLIQNQKIKTRLINLRYVRCTMYSGLNLLKIHSR